MNDRNGTWEEWGRDFPSQKMIFIRFDDFLSDGEKAENRRKRKFRNNDRNGSSTVLIKL